MGRPNELSGQVRPNTLAGAGGRQRSSGGTSTTPTRTLRTPASPTPTAGPSAPTAATTARRAGRGRSLSTLWSLIFFGIVFFNLARGFLGASSASPEPTSGPPATAVPAATTGGGDRPVGSVEFGTTQLDGCELSGTAETFSAGTDVYWWAHFAEPLEADARVTWVLLRSGVRLESNSGPGDDPTGPWDGLCGNDPLTYPEAGSYTLEVWTGDNRSRLAVGTYTLKAP